MAQDERPEGGGHGWLTLVAVALLALVLLLLVAPDAASILRTRDHGNQLAKAVQIALGRHPFVDYPNGVYGPLVFYVSYVGQALSGSRLLGEVAVVCIGYALAHVLLFRTFALASRSRWIAWSLLLLALLLLPRFYKYYIVLAPAAFLCGLWSHRFRERGRTASAWLAVSIVAAGLLRFDYGFHALLAALLYVVLQAPAPRLREATRELLWIAAAGLLCIAPLLLLMFLFVSPGEALAGVLDASEGVLRGLGKPLPTWTPEAGLLAKENLFFLTFWGFRALPYLVALGALLCWRRFSDRRERAAVLATSAFAALVFLQATHRVDVFHLLQVLPPALVLLAWALGALVRQPTSGGRRALRLGTAATVPALVLFFFWPAARTEVLTEPVTTVRLLPGKLASWRMRPAELRQARSWEAAAARFVHDATEPTADVLFLPYRPTLHYLAQRGFATPFGWLHPGRFLARTGEEDFVAALGTTHVLMDEPRASYDNDPTRNARVYAPLVMRALYTRYGIVRRFGPVFILTDESRLLADARLPASFQPLAAGLGAAAPVTGLQLTALNTLPIVAGQPAEMPRGGGLLLHARAPARGGRLPVVRFVLTGPGGVFEARARAEPASAGGGVELELLADTRAVPAGTYELRVAVDAPAGADPLAASSCGVRVRIVEPGD